MTNFSIDQSQLPPSDGELGLRYLRFHQARRTVDGSPPIAPAAVSNALREPRGAVEIEGTSLTWRERTIDIVQRFRQQSGNAGVARRLAGGKWNLFRRNDVRALEDATTAYSDAASKAHDATIDKVTKEEQLRNVGALSKVGGWMVAGGVVVGGILWGASASAAYSALVALENLGVVLSAVTAASGIGVAIARPFVERRRTTTVDDARETERAALTRLQEAEQVLEGAAQEVGRNGLPITVPEAGGRHEQLEEAFDGALRETGAALREKYDATFGQLRSAETFATDAEREAWELVLACVDMEREGWAQGERSPISSQLRKALAECVGQDAVDQTARQFAYGPPALPSIPADLMPPERIVTLS